MRLSIIVATRNRARAIAGCLDSIVAALAYATPLDAEIIVVDNGSTDDTGAVVTGWASACTFPVQLLSEPKAGLSRAHNRALRAARGDLLAFTDDDCRLCKEYFEQLLCHDAGDTGLVLRGGRIELGDATDLPLTINTAPTLMRWSLRNNSARYRSICGQISGCNMTMRRALVDRLGPFDENLGSGSFIGAGADADYALRAYLVGATIEYVPDMTVFHYHGRKTKAAGKALLRRYMIANGALYARYLLKHATFCRPFFWDCKYALKEIATGRNLYLPDIGFSNKHKVMYSLHGALKYIFISMNPREANAGITSTADVVVDRDRSGQVS
jgi:glycosyltransferase involved in cell wall biosynthesis